MNKIFWTRKAVKQLLKLHSQHQAQVRDAVARLKAMPDVPNVKSLVSHGCEYRLRVGAYRVLFDWDSGVRIISVQEVRKRDEHAY